MAAQLSGCRTFCLSLQLEDSTVGGKNVFGLFFFGWEGGGEGDLTERNLGRKPPENV